MQTPPISKRPFHGAPSTVSTIIEAALKSQNDYVVRQLAESICGDLRTKDYLSEGLAIHHFVCARVRYTRDPRTIELVRSPSLVAKELLAGGRPLLDCDDISALILALLLSLGSQARIVTVAFKHMFYQGQRQYSHVFVQMYEPKSRTWVTLDPVAGEKTRAMMKRVVASKVYPVV